jgi:flagellar hook-length control protein FliK
VQAAAQTALPTGDQQAAAASTKSSLGPKAHGRALLRGIPVPGAATAPAQSARLAGAHGAKQKSFPLREALQKALVAAESQQKHGKAVSVKGAALHAGPKLSGEAGAARSLLAEAASEKKSDVQSAKPGQAAEAAAPSRKKTTPALHGTTGAEAAAAALARELLKNFPAPGVALKTPETSDQGKETPAVHAASRKAADPKIHVVDARHRRVDQALDDALLALRPPRASVSEKDAAAALVHKLDGSREAVASEVRRPQSPAPGAFAGALDRLRDMAGSEMMKATGIILRDGGGEIKLVLKPESLGSVRIRVNLVDNAIEGRIIVDNPAVKQVFDGNINSLMRALTAEGFQTASLQVSVGGQNTDNGREEREAPSRVRRVRAQDFERNVPGLETMSLDDLLVNLFA